MNYRELLYDKHKYTMTPIRQEQSTYYIYSGFKFERLRTYAGDVYRVWNTCAQNGFYVTVNSEIILRKMFLAKDLTGWAERLKKLEQCETINEYCAILSQIIEGESKGPNFCHNCGERLK